MKERRKNPSAMTASSSRSRCVMIPDDVMFEILSWLPVPPLMRFKSVCKSWRTIIESPDFISRQLHLSDMGSNQENKLVILTPYDQRSPYYSFTFDIISINDLQLYKSVEFIPFSDSYKKTGEQLIASYDGIICFKYKTRESYGWIDVVSLWNPATKQITILPPPQSLVVETANMHIYHGFGFDVKTNDYKVVRIVFSYKRPLHNDTQKNSQVEVYSLRMDSWRLIDAVVPVKIFIVSGPGKPFRKEIYCWLGYDWNSQHCYILTFNFSDETFGTIPVPELYKHDSGWILSLAFVREKIAIISEDTKKTCQIWVLDEYGVKESWTNLYTVVLDRVKTPLAFTADGKILARNRAHELLCLYDPLTQEINDVPTLGDGCDSVVYKESLVPARSANGATDRVPSEVLLSVCSMYPYRMKPPGVSDSI